METRKDKAVDPAVVTEETIERFPYMVDGEDPDVGDVFGALLDGKPVTTTVNTSRGAFVLKYPTGKDHQSIRVQIADEKMGRPDESFGWKDRQDIAAIAMLNVMVINGPAWWDTRMKRRWENCPDTALIRELLARGRLFRQQVDRDIGSSPFGRSLAGATREPDPQTVGGGAFSGLAHGPTSPGDE